MSPIVGTAAFEPDWGDKAAKIILRCYRFFREKVRDFFRNTSYARTRWVGEPNALNERSSGRTTFARIDCAPGVLKEPRSGEVSSRQSGRQHSCHGFQEAAIAAAL
jgi:hypothetical protein